MHLKTRAAWQGWAGPGGWRAICWQLVPLATWETGGAAHWWFLDPTLLKSCLQESECSPSPPGYPLHGPKMQLNTCREQERKASIIATSCARAQPVKTPKLSRPLGGRGDGPERHFCVVAPLLLHPLHFDFSFCKRGSGSLLAEESGEGNEASLGVLGHRDGVKGLCTQAALGPRAAKGRGGFGLHHSGRSLSTLSPGHP